MVYIVPFLLAEHGNIVLNGMLTELLSPRVCERESESYPYDAETIFLMYMFSSAIRGTASLGRFVRG